MKNNNINKFQLLIWLMLLVSMRISYVNAEQPSKVSYQQWKSEQQSQDRQLKKAPTTNTTSSSHYLSKPALSSASNSQKIKLNSASVELFQQLSGIGKKKAEAIVAYRSKNGKFKSIDEIQDVKGIGPAIFAKNKDRLAL